MPRWKYTVDLRDIWKNDVLSFEQTRDLICKRLRNSNWYADMGEPFSNLDFAVEELQDSSDLTEFDCAFSTIYDLADYDRAWIATSLQ